MSPGARRRLAILAPLKPWGGIEGKLVTLCREFEARGVDTELVRPRGGAVPYPERLPEGFRTVDLGTRSKRDGVPAFARYLRRERPDAVLTAKDHAAQVAILARWLSGIDVPVFVKVTNTLSDVARRRLKRAMIRWLYPRADAVIANSQSGADDLARHFAVPEDRIRVIYNPTVTPDFEDRAGAAVDHPWLSSPGVPVITAAGRLTPQKDFRTLVRALARLGDRRPCRLIILGEGDERPALEGLIRELGVSDRVDLPGAVPDALPWMRRSAAFVLSSLYEGLPNVLIEAMSLGTPVVATDCGGVGEILEDGRLGPIVPTGDAEGLAAAIDATLQDPVCADRLVHGAARFASAPVAERYLEIMGLAPLGTGVHARGSLP